MRRVHLIALLALTTFVPRAGRAQLAVVSDPVAEHDAAPGQSYQARVMVRNTTKQPQDARIYVTDYSFAADGRTDYGPAGSLPRSNAKWLAVSTSFVTIPPETTVPIAYTVTVPADTSLRGSYWSMVMIEAGAVGSVAARQANARVQVGLMITTRYGTQVATHIGKTGESRLAFDSLAATSDSSGKRGLQFDFINTGERANRYMMSLELYNEAGELVKKASQQRGLLYPGTAARQLFDVGAVPHGAYTAVVVADGGGDQVFGGQFKVSY